MFTSYDQALRLVSSSRTQVNSNGSIYSNRHLLLEIPCEQAQPATSMRNLQDCVFGNKKNEAKAVGCWVGAAEDGY
jgi:hypothetical protein